jgi:hypothetical protein
LKPPIFLKLLPSIQIVFGREGAAGGGGGGDDKATGLGGRGFGTFGGGGGSTYEGGGGGGYTGGTNPDTNQYSTNFPQYGSGSYNTGTSQSNFVLSSVGAGFVTITRL